MSQTYESDICAVVHETAQDLYDAGVMSKQTMRSFDIACLIKIEPMTPEQIRNLCEHYNVSHSVSARHQAETVSPS